MPRNVFKSPRKRTGKAKKMPVKKGLDLTNKSAKVEAKKKLKERDEDRLQRQKAYDKKSRYDAHGNNTPKKNKSESGVIPVTLNVLKVHAFIVD